MKTRTLPLVFFVAILLLFGLLFSLPQAEDASAAPLAAPTPVSATYAGGESSILNFWRTGSALTADVGSNIQTIQDHEVVDLQWNIDQTVTASGANTVTLKLQFSNDNSTWTDGATFVTSNSEDASGLEQFALFGRYARVYADVSLSQPVTVTVIGVGK